MVVEEEEEASALDRWIERQISFSRLLLMHLAVYWLYMMKEREK